MNIITILLVLAAVGFVVWLISKFLPQNPKMALLFQVVAVALMLLWVLQQFHLAMNLPHVHF